MKQQERALYKMKNETFLDIYKKFESAVRVTRGCTVKEYEDTFDNDPTKQEKIRISRMMRNYLSHQDMKFIEVTQDMIDFIQNELIQLDEGELPVKKKMISTRITPKETELLTTTCDWMSKKKIAATPIFNEKDFAVGVITQNDIVKFVASGNFNKTKKTSVIVSPYKFKFLSETTPMKTVYPMIEKHDQIYLILSQANKVIGWIL